MNKLDFSDINLIPNKCIVSSRSECNTSIKFGKFTFKLPVVPANMASIVDEKLCIKLAENGYFYIMHRFGVDNIEFVKTMKDKKLISSISIGVNKDSYDIIDQLHTLKLNPDYVTIDIAHGWSDKTRKMIKYIKSKINTFIIAGNVADGRAVEDLQKWGADAIKIGIGPGYVCETYRFTGFGTRGAQASALVDCFNSSDVPLIIDGGLREPGDISKALVLGASMCMVGSMLAGFIESPGNLIRTNDGEYKEFYGSASSIQKGNDLRVEGKRDLIKFKPRSVLTEYKFIEECLQSSISYAGGKTLESLRDVDYIYQSTSV